MGVPEIGRVIVMKVSEGRWSGPLEHLFLIIRQAILELRARPVAPLWPFRPDFGRANGPSRGQADGSRFGSLNLERVEPDHTSSRIRPWLTGSTTRATRAANPPV